MKLLNLKKKERERENSVCEDGHKIYEKIYQDIKVTVGIKGGPIHLLPSSLHSIYQFATLGKHK